MRAAKRAEKRKRNQSDTGEGIPPEAAAAAIAAAIPEQKITKKERDRLAKAGQTEEVLHRAANDAVSMAFGGRKKKQYSWMNSGAGSGSGPASGTVTPRRLDTSVGGLSGGGLLTNGSAGSAESGTPGWANGKPVGPHEKRFGDWKEDSAKGKGIQMRDLVLAFEMDGSVKKTLVKCLAKLRNNE
jgi:hypothetical protein